MDAALPLRHPKTGRILFSCAELACPLTGGCRLGLGFAPYLLRLRLAYDAPMRVTSCCRSRAHNAAIGGHPRSLHIYDDPHHETGGSIAIDIALRDGFTRRHLLRIALDLGWSAGVGRDFLHLDRRDLIGLPPVVFVY